MSLRLVLGLVFALVLASSPALACKGPNVIFADNFSEPDPAWPESEKFVIGSNRVQLKSDPGGVTGGFYGGSLFEDADICIDVVIPQAKDPKGINAGLVFWADDWDNFYMFQLDGSGDASVYRSQKGKGLFPVSWRKAPPVKTAANVVNNLRLTLKGASASAFINDRPFVAFKGMPPKGGGKIGLFAASENGAVNVWTFSSLKVTDVR